MTLRSFCNLQLPNLSGQACPSIGKLTSLIGQSALIVSLWNIEISGSELVWWINHLGRGSRTGESLPHGVENSSILHYSEEFIRSCHIVSNWFLAIPKKVSGVQILLTIKLFKLRISAGPPNFNLSSVQVWRKKTSIVYS